MRYNTMQHNKNDGFTIIELMIVIVIVAILLSIAIPSFATLIKKNNVETLQANLSSAVATARSEAASRNVVVSMCISNAAGTACATGPQWVGAGSGGWLIFEDNNGDGLVTAAAAPDPADEIIDFFSNTGNYTLKADNATTGADIVSVSFNSRGFLSRTRGTINGNADAGVDTIFTVCEPGNDAYYARGLYLNKSGLVMKTTDTDDAGVIHNIPGANVQDLVCP